MTDVFKSRCGFQCTHPNDGPEAPRAAAAAWWSKHSHRVFWIGRWTQMAGTGAWLSAAALF